MIRNSFKVSVYKGARNGTIMSAHLEWQHRFPADLERVDDVVRDILKRLEVAGFGAQRFAIELLLREALINAVQHGSRGDPRKSVFLSLQLGGERLIMEVADEGPGFNWQEALSRQPDDRAESGRGLAIMKHFARTLEFNDRGNWVKITV
jgi:serine/threonine-protein kinase RsbW